MLLNRYDENALLTNVNVKEKTTGVTRRPRRRFTRLEALANPRLHTEWYEGTAARIRAGRGRR